MDAADALELIAEMADTWINAFPPSDDDLAPATRDLEARKKSSNDLADFLRGVLARPTIHRQLQPQEVLAILSRYDLRVDKAVNSRNNASKTVAFCIAEGVNNLPGDDGITMTHLRASQCVPPRLAVVVAPDGHVLYIGPMTQLPHEDTLPHGAVVNLAQAEYEQVKRRAGMPPEEPKVSPWQPARDAKIFPGGKAEEDAWAEIGEASMARNKHLPDG